jgi:hypothetical protein
MAHINGLTQPVYIGSGVTPQAPAAGNVAAQGTTAGNTAIIDGTPVRVVVLCLAAAFGLAALGAAGVKFSIGAST